MPTCPSMSVPIQVGVQTHQEAHPLHRPQPGLAPQQRASGCRLLRLQVPVSQGPCTSMKQGLDSRGQVLSQALGRASVPWVEHQQAVVLHLFTLARPFQALGGSLPSRFLACWKNGWVYLLMLWYGRTLLIIVGPVLPVSSCFSLLGPRHRVMPFWVGRHWLCASGHVRWLGSQGFCDGVEDGVAGEGRTKAGGARRRDAWDELGDRTSPSNSHGWVRSNLGSLGL